MKLLIRTGEPGSWTGTSARFIIERLLSNKGKKEDLKLEKVSARDIIKDPYVLEFLNIPQPQEFSENELESAIISNLQGFLLELGKGFAFVGRQYHMKTDTRSDNATIGIILCAEKDQALVKYSVLDENKHIFASKYKLILPTTDELKVELEREIHSFRKRVLEN